jgi:hypothetical protein
MTKHKVCTFIFIGFELLIKSPNKEGSRESPLGFAKEDKEEIHLGFVVRLRNLDGNRRESEGDRGKGNITYTKYSCLMESS